jgi:hypothetical protein
MEREPGWYQKVKRGPVRIGSKEAAAPRRLEGLEGGALMAVGCLLGVQYLFSSCLGLCADSYRPVINPSMGGGRRGRFVGCRAYGHIKFK